jgi:hypothetical protein
MPLLYHLFAFLAHQGRSHAKYRTHMKTGRLRMGHFALRNMSCPVCGRLDTETHVIAFRPMLERQQSRPQMTLVRQ